LVSNPNCSNNLEKYTFKDGQEICNIVLATVKKEQLYKIIIK